jgi:hypothetical protein
MNAQLTTAFWDLAFRCRRVDLNFAGPTSYRIRHTKTQMPSDFVITLTFSMNLVSERMVSIGALYAATLLRMKQRGKYQI